MNGYWGTCVHMFFWMYTLAEERHSCFQGWIMSMASIVKVSSSDPSVCLCFEQWLKQLLFFWVLEVFHRWACPVVARMQV